MKTIKNYFMSIFYFKGDLLKTILSITCFSLLLVLFLTMPLFTTRSGYTTITNLLSIATCFSISVYIILRGKVFLNYFVILTVVFVIYATIVTLIGSRSYSTLKSIFTLYALSLFTFEFCANLRCTKLVIYCVLAGISLLTIVFLIESAPELIKAISGNSHLDRLGDKYGNLNYIGRTFALGSLIFTIIAVIKKRFYFFFLIGTFATALATFLTGSRGALLILFLNIVIPFFFVFNKKRKWIYFVSLAAFIGLVVLLIQLPPFAGIKASFEKVFDFSGKTNGDASASRRLAMFQDGILLWLKRLFFGYGAYGFSKVSSYGTYSHNSLSEILCSFGLVGTILFYVPVIILVKKSFIKNFGDNKLFHVLSITFIISFLVLGILFFVLHIDKILILFLSLLFAFEFEINMNSTNYFTVSFFEKDVQKNNRTFIKFDINKNKNNKAKQQLETQSN